MTQNSRPGGKLNEDGDAGKAVHCRAPAEHEPDLEFALDTNVLVYANGLNGPEKRQRAASVIERPPVGSVTLLVQVLTE